MTYFVIHNDINGERQIGICGNASALSDYLRAEGIEQFATVTSMADVRPEPAAMTGFEVWSHGDFSAGRDLERWPGGTALIIAGEIVVPRAAQVVTEWQLDR